MFFFKGGTFSLYPWMPQKKYIAFLEEEKIHSNLFNCPLLFITNWGQESGSGLNKKAGFGF
jgi:hypothetical protein